MAGSVRNHVHRPDPLKSRRLNFESLEDRRMLATITVTSLADNLTVDGQVTLREAVRAAELNISVDGSTSGSGADTIQFAASLNGAVNLSVVGDTGAGATALLISSEITIRGNDLGIAIQRATPGPEMRPFRVSASGNLTLERLTLTGGVAQGDDGIVGLPNGVDGRGGAILNQGSLTVTASTLHNNRAAGGNAASGGNGGAGLGGAIYNDGGNLAIVNATLSGNLVEGGTGSLVGPFIGAGVYSRNGTLTISNSTITNNPAIPGRGVYVIGDGGPSTAAVNSTIIGQSDTSVNHSDFVATVVNGGTVQTSGVGNIIRRAVGFDGTVVSTDDPQLGALGPNGGPTPTHALAAESPAVNQGYNPMSLATDQRGASYQRVSNGIADVGAFERQVAGGPNPAGDFDRNSIVDMADYVLWRNTFGTGVTAFSGADGNGDGQINEADHGVWRANFGRTPTATATFEVVPKVVVAPATITANSPSPGVPSIEVTLEAPGITVIPTHGTEHSQPFVDEISAERPDQTPTPKKLAHFLPTRSRNLLELVLVGVVDASTRPPRQTLDDISPNLDARDGDSDAQVVDELLADWPFVYRRAIA